MEMMTAKLPDVSHLRVFGLKVYVHNTTVKSKLKPRASTGIRILVGYPEDTKGYRILMDGACTSECAVT
jgi:hypothetical protein